MTTTRVPGSEPATRRHLLHRIGRLAGGVLLLGAVAVAVAVALLPGAVGGRALTVLSESMEPTLPLGSLLVIRPRPAAEIGVGDVVTFLDRGAVTGASHLVTHRVIAVEPGPVFHTQGDNSPAPDRYPVRPADVQGVLWYPVPLVGEAFTVLATWRGLLILGGGALVVAAYALLGSRDGRRSRAFVPARRRGPTA